MLTSLICIAMVCDVLVYATLGLYASIFLCLSLPLILRYVLFCLFSYYYYFFFQFRFKCFILNVLCAIFLPLSIILVRRSMPNRNRATLTVSDNNQRFVHAFALTIAMRSLTNSSCLICVNVLSLSRLCYVVRRFYIKIRNQTGNNNRKYSIGIKCAYNDSDEYNDYRTHTGTVVALKMKNPTKHKGNKKEKKELYFFIYKRSERSFSHKYNYGHRKHIQSMMKEIANS